MFKDNDVSTRCQKQKLQTAVLLNNVAFRMLQEGFLYKGSKNTLRNKFTF